MASCCCFCCSSANQRKTITNRTNPRHEPTSSSARYNVDGHHQRLNFLLAPHWSSYILDQSLKWGSISLERRSHLDQRHPGSSGLIIENQVLLLPPHPERHPRTICGQMDRSPQPTSIISSWCIWYFCLSIFNLLPSTWCIQVSVVHRLFCRSFFLHSFLFLLFPSRWINVNKCCWQLPFN